MIGSGVLIECLDDPRVKSVLSFVRTPTGNGHAKLREQTRSDFYDFDDAREEFSRCDACFFCLGVSAAGMTEADYYRLTYDVTMAAARLLAAVRPRATFCFVSGQGADSTEKGRLMWARVKGKTENALLGLPLETYVFRPGFIQPLKGVESRTRLYRTFYRLTAPLLPAMKRLAPGQITTTVNVGRAMINVADRGYRERVLDNAAINRAAALD
jgi:hypothetical protein